MARIWRRTVGLSALAALAAAVPCLAEEQPGWDWGARPQIEAREEPATQVPSGSISEAVSGEAAEETSEKAGESEAGNSEAGVAGAISGIMQPNRGQALSNDADIEALRRRAQTGRPR